MSPKTTSCFRASSLLALVVLAACGDSASADDPKSAPGGKPGAGAAQAAAEENARPPVPGAPLEGVFVSASRGDDANDGSMAKPLKTLAAATSKGKETQKRVLACAETYPEAVTVVDGVSMYGYFDCGAAAWKLDDSKRARIVAPTSPAMKVEKVGMSTRVEGFEVVAPDLGEGSPAERDAFQTSSIALWVSGSTNVTFGKDSFKAGKGRDGVDGTDPAALVRSDARMPVAGENEARCDSPALCSARFSGGVGGVASCGADMPANPGGKGGKGSWSANLQPGSGEPLVATAQTAQGGVVNTTRPIDAAPGMDGLSGASGLDAANGAFALTVGGPKVGDGALGGDGGLGQAGGGGASTGWIGGSTALGSRFSGSGGGGGAGGCPGLAGSPGLGGGASIGVYVVTSRVAFERSSVQSSTGGSAGRGTLGSVETVGQTGAPGGYATQSDGTPFACLDGDLRYCIGGAGGAGGAGGRAGVSGHGAAGPSYGVVHVGDAPKLDNETTIAAGEGGEGAPELTRGPASIPASPKGASEKVLAAR